jgi:hypothetical protein
VKISEDTMSRSSSSKKGVLLRSLLAKRISYFERNYFEKTLTAIYKMKKEEKYEAVRCLLS